ncbi:MAG TPA: DUF3108 domain-containing protein [Saprospiraceae bacterium]|nr:DUF3108 domain-containing protein [Saprospiraceae bacterium]HMP24268.1 DUF3108 domain-containing protein [Saprospiraceae bacterium]
MRKLMPKAGIMVSMLLVLMAFDQPVSRITQIDNPLPANNREALAEICSINNVAFRPGEEMTYKLYYNWNFVWLSAGEVTFRVTDKGSQYLLSAHGRTYKSYEWFYKVRDKYDTYVDKSTLLPAVSIRDVSEGNYRLYDKITFDRNRNKAVSLRGKSKDTATPTEYDIDFCMHDILSVIYSTRNLDFNKMKAGSTLPVKIFIDKETWPLQVKYLGKDPDKKIKGMGRFRAIQFSPQVVEGFYFKKGTEMKVWASDDKNKIPLMIESPLSVGSVKAVLKDYKGLKYDLTAMIKYDKNTKDGDLPDD